MTTILQNFQKKLQEDGIINEIYKFKHFKEALIASKGIVAGSYILQAIHDTNYLDSDIDIWVTGDVVGKPPHHYEIYNDEHIIKYLMKMGCRYISTTSEPGKYGRMRAVVKNIVKLESDKKQIQIIRLRGLVRHADITPYINPTYKLKQYNQLYINLTVYDVVHTFDFDMCRVLYDPNGKKILAVTDTGTSPIDSAVKKTISLTTAARAQTLNEWFRGLERLAKYLGRGFTLNNPKDLIYSVFNSYMNWFYVKDYFQKPPIPDEACQAIAEAKLPLSDYSTDKSINNNQLLIIKKKTTIINHLLREQPRLILSYLVTLRVKACSSCMTLTLTPINYWNENKKTYVYNTYFYTTKQIPQIRTQEPKCFDLLMADDISIKDFFQQSSTNGDTPILLVYMNHHDRGMGPVYKFTCLNRADLHDMVHDPTKIHYGCPPQNDRQKYVLISLKLGHWLLPYEDVVDMLQSRNTVFLIRPTDTKLKRTQSKIYKLGRPESAVGGNHCQNGTSMTVYRAHGINIGDNDLTGTQLTGYIDAMVKQLI